MFATLPQVANVDWNIVAGAVATFVVTAVVTAFGFRKGIKRVVQARNEPTQVVGAALMDNMSMLLLTEALKENTDLHRQIHGCLIKIETLLQLGLNKRS
jgi:putative Mn2+ efflux pump MntP